MNLGDLMELVKTAEYIASNSYEHGLGGEQDYEPDLEKFCKVSNEDLTRLVGDLHELVKGVCKLKSTTL